MAIFLFTDIEGSTKKWEKYPELMKQCLIKHDAIIKESVENHGGKIIKHTGDGVFAVFDNGQPLECALKVQKYLAEVDWSELGELRVRIGLHAGHVDKRGGDYFGPVINRTSRVMSVAWGGQIILTPSVKNSVKLPKDAILEDLGVHMLKDLGEPQNIYQLVHPELPLTEFPPLRSLSARPHNLPIQATPFLGREKELVEIGKLLRDPSCRLLTLIGPGGIGKTRLAIQGAAEEIEDFAHGVYFIILEPLTSMDFLMSTIAEALRFSFYGQKDQKAQLLDYLREKEVLLILDNFEHLVEGAGIIADILSAAPKVKILVTSRELLNLRGEWILQIKGMDVPEGERIDVEGYSAVQLFFYNAQRVRAKVSISGEDKVHVARICQLVGGLPLGIEIASSWLRTLTCKEIAQEIEKSFDFLATSLRDVPARHRSLRAVFEYSWKLISDKEKQVLKRLSVFRGGFQRKAAENIAGASLTDLLSLTDKSLLYREANGRYNMFEILRQYTGEKLNKEADENEQVECLHCKYYADFMYQREKSISSEIGKEVYSEIKEEIENVRKALNWAIDRKKVEYLDKFAITMYFVYNHYGWYHEGDRLYQNALESISKRKTQLERVVYEKLATRYAIFRYSMGFYDEARKLLEESLVISQEYGIQREIAQTLMTLGNIDAILGDYDNATTRYEEVLKIWRDIDDKKNIAGLLNNLGVIHYYKKEYAEARKLYEESVDISNDVHHKQMKAMAIGNLGLVAHELGDYNEAKRLLRQCLDIEREFGDRSQIANTLNNLGMAYYRLKDYDTAREIYGECLKIRKELGDRLGNAAVLHNLANLALDLGNFEEARQLCDENIAIYKEIDHKRGFAEALVRRGEVSYRAKEYPVAEKYFAEGMKTAIAVEHASEINNALAGLLRVYYRRGDIRRAFETKQYVSTKEITEDSIKNELKSIDRSLLKKLSSKAIKNIERKKKIKTEDYAEHLLRQEQS
ncbi:MAG: tetratricopeptide repeat protein [bacterium]